ncbi:AbrB/MazE/SpoVT family DNA-binding domain-containing protein [Peribacillus butanolivorans]|uniref:AbrB/MazE/SpoVT family DNA-binding domain-containing protein n=1 Tax=Peribacillus butanolivorans TaxID=421767 RepID=UPI00381D91C3
MAIRKLTKVGNSLGITFLVEMLKHANLAFGDELEVEFKGEEIIFIIYLSTNQIIAIDAIQ